MPKKTLKVLIIGSGGREHALAWKVAQSPMVRKIFVAPGNAGTDRVAENLAIESTDFTGLIKFATENKIGLTIVGPDEPLALGIVDEFQKRGLRIFGPTRDAARIESSKAFSKSLMRRMNIPTASYKVCDDYDNALEYVGDLDLPIVIKASGLALGKGVSICRTRDQVVKTLKAIMIDKIFGDSGNEVVIEEYLGAGQEISIHAITDGKAFILFPTSQDHKAIHDGDNGPNTGGMGTYAPIPWAGNDYLDWAADKVITPALTGLATKGSRYRGLLYPGLKLTDDGPRVLEFNARFGDPETQSYMRLLETDLVEIIEACLNGTLSTVKVSWKPGFAVCIILASRGYPTAKSRRARITGIGDAENIPNVVVFHAGTTMLDGKLYASGGRVVGVTATAETLEQAIRTAYQAVDKIRFEGMQYRTDIGLKALDEPHVQPLYRA